MACCIRGVDSLEETVPPPGLKMFAAAAAAESGISRRQCPSRLAAAARSLAAAEAAAAAQAQQGLCQTPTALRHRHRPGRDDKRRFEKGREGN